MATSTKELKRFLREAEILSRLRHENIVEFREMGQSGELLYFAMQYVPGSDARGLLKRHGPLSIGQAVGWICQMILALTLLGWA